VINLALKNNLYIFGARGSGLKVLQCVLDENLYNVVGFIDDDPSLLGKEFCGIPVIGNRELLLEALGYLKLVVIAVGDPQARFDIVKYLKYAPSVYFPTIEHPSAQISEFSIIDEGNVFCQNVVIQPGVEIGTHCLFNISAAVGPLAKVGNFCTVNSHSFIASESEISDLCYIGMGSKIMQKIKIGERCIVGANTFVNRNLAPNKTYVGNPARAI